MARRGSIDSVREFFDGFNQTYSATKKVMQDAELNKIATANPEQSQGFTAEDGQHLEAIANAKDANGKPYYSLTANPDGSYAVTDNSNPESPATVIAQHGITDFMGQRQAGPMSDGQVASARQRAMAGVLAKSDPIAAMRLSREVTQGERDDQRFAWDKARNERDLSKMAQADSDEALLRSIDQDAGDWHASRLKNPDGTDRAAGVDDFLATTQYKAFKLAGAGKLNEASQAFKDYAAQSAVKLHLETEQRNVALGKTAAALSTGDLDAVRDFYNTYVPDGAKVKDVKRDPKTGHITIERESLDGRAMPPTVMKDTGQLVSTLAAFKDPMAIYNWSQNEFRNNLALKAEARAGASAAVSDRLHNAQIDELGEKTAAKKELGQIHDDLNAALDKGDKAAEDVARKKLLSYTTGSKGTQHMSSLEQKANLYLASGKAKTMADALDLANTKVQSSAKDDYMKFTTSAMPLQGEQLSEAMKTLHGEDWQTKVRGEGAKPAAALKTPPTDEDIKATAKKYGISEAEVKKRLGL